MRLAISIPIAAALLATSVALQVRRDRGWQAYEPATPVMWITAGPWTRRAALGYDALVADIYWIRTVVYFGRQRLSEAADKTYDLLFPMLEMVTLLDPRFEVAYRYGAIFLCEPYPQGPGRPDLAVELLERGLARDPGNWKYARDIGFVYSWWYRDYDRAADWFEKASEMPEAPIWLKSSAAITRTQGGDRETARMLWRQMLDSVDVDWVRENARIRIAQLDVLDQLDALNLAVWRYEARVGRFPRSWGELIAAGVVRGVPRDPTGMPYVLDQENEDVRLSPDSELWPLPVDQGPMAP